MATKKTKKSARSKRKPAARGKPVAPVVSGIKARGALIVAIGHGGDGISDPYSCSCRSGCVFDIAADALAFICDEQVLPEESVEEILVVQGDIVVHHFLAEHWLNSDEE